MADIDRWVLERMNIPERFWGASYDLVPEPHRAPLRAFHRKLPEMLKRGAGFYLHGPTGVGKTSFGIVLLKAAWERGLRGYYTTVKDLRLSLKEDIAFEGNESVMMHCKDVDLLVLDDLAADDLKTFSLSISEIEHLLSSRASRSRCTILSTRLTPDVFRTEYPSILQTMQGSFVSLAFTGPNQKEAAAAELRRELGVL